VVSRRAFFAALLPVYTTSTREGFVFIGHLTNAGQEAERYYAIGQGCALMLDPKVLPTCVAGADALLNQQVEVSLVKAR
jgi:hypothetical protein